MPAQQPDLLTINACLEQAFSFSCDLAVELTPSRLVAGTVTPEQPIQVRQPGSPIRHGIVHKPTLIFIRVRPMIAASECFTMRNISSVNVINVVYFTCYWDVKPSPRRRCGARLRRAPPAWRGCNPARLHPTNPQRQILTWSQILGQIRAARLRRPGSSCCAWHCVATLRARSLPRSQGAELNPLPPGAPPSAAPAGPERLS